MTNILAFTGRRYAGKSCCASIVSELDPRFSKFSFADIPKTEFAEMLDITKQELDVSYTKETYRQRFISYVEDKKKNDKAYWAKKLFDRIEDEEFVVIDDLRFIEELQGIVERKGVIYKIQTDPEVRKVRGWIPNKYVDSHYSETEMDLSPYTFYTLTGGGVIYNNDAERDSKLKGQIYNILNKHFN